MHTPANENSGQVKGSSAAEHAGREIKKFACLDMVNYTNYEREKTGEERKKRTDSR